MALRRKKNRLYRHVITPSASITMTPQGPQFSLGGGVQLVPTDKTHVQLLIDLIDNKGVFYDPVAFEQPQAALLSIKEVRALAVSTQAQVEALEVRDLCGDIAASCRTFMNHYNIGFQTVVQSALFDALRHEVFTAASALIDLCNMPTPRNIPYDGFRPRGITILQAMIDDAQ